MSKTIRWTFYSILIAGALIFGYLVTFNQDPESYLPTPEAPLVERGPAAGGAARGEWEIEVKGKVLSLEERGEEVRLMLDVGAVEGAGSGPLLDPRVEVRGAREHFVKLPEAGEEIRFSARGSRQRPAFLEISEVVGER